MDIRIKKLGLKVIHSKVPSSENIHILHDSLNTEIGNLVNLYHLISISNVGTFTRSSIMFTEIPDLQNLSESFVIENSCIINVKFLNIRIIFENLKFKKLNLQRIIFFTW